MICSRDCCSIFIIFGNNKVIKDFILIGIIYKTIKLVYRVCISYWNVKSDLGLRDRNIQVIFDLKVVLKFRDREIFGITASFYEMLTERPCFGGDLFNFCLNFVHFFFWFWAFMTRQLLKMTAYIIMLTFFVFTNIWTIFSCTCGIFFDKLKSSLHFC